MATLQFSRNRSGGPLATGQAHFEAEVVKVLEGPSSVSVGPGPGHSGSDGVNGEAPPPGGWSQVR